MESRPVTSHPVMRGLLLLTGIGVLVVGANVGLGGIRTAGLQVDPGFVTATDPVAFANQDNHVRFFGGVFAAVGLAFVAGAVWFVPLRPLLIGLCAIIAVAGLFRFSGNGLAIVTNPALAPSLALELIYFPLLGLWLSRCRV